MTSAKRFDSELWGRVTRNALLSTFIISHNWHQFLPIAIVGDDRFETRDRMYRNRNNGGATLSIDTMYLLQKALNRGHQRPLLTAIGCATPQPLHIVNHNYYKGSKLRPPMSVAFTIPHESRPPVCMLLTTNRGHQYYAHFPLHVLTLFHSSFDQLSPQAVSCVFMWEGYCRQFMKPPQWAIF